MFDLRSCSCRNICFFKMIILLWFPGIEMQTDYFPFLDLSYVWKPTCEFNLEHNSAVDGSNSFKCVDDPENHFAVWHVETKMDLAAITSLSLFIFLCTWYIVRLSLFLFPVIFRSLLVIANEDVKQFFFVKFKIWLYWIISNLF